MMRCGKWKLYVGAREIVEILLAPAFPAGVLGFLALLIESFLYEFALKFPGKMTPKMHFMMHYPRLIADYGPLRALWCLRFEAKHQYFKKIANGQNNFRNICRTFADRHQSQQCWEFTVFYVFGFISPGRRNSWTICGAS